MSMVTFNVEVTDTFGGEANYCWVHRFSFEMDETKSDLAIVRHAKQLAGWSGLRCKREDWGEDIVLRPYGICQIMFVSPSY